jgi:hypothetical protein
MTLIVAVGYLTAVASASTTVYLRPNSAAVPTSYEGSSPVPWKVIGAPSAWEAVNDKVDESQTPSSADYISADAPYSTLNAVEFGFPRVPLKGSTVVSATVWTYVGASGPIKADLRSGGTVLKEDWFGSVGWRSVSVPLNGSQSQLDNLKLRYFGANMGGAASIEASFLRLTLDPGPLRIYWGAWMDGDVYAPEYPNLGDAPWDSTTWNLFEGNADKKVSIVHFGQPPPWEQEFAPGPLELARSRGAIPLMSMGPGYEPGKERKEQYRIPLTEIDKGNYDKSFGEWAEAVADYEHPFFFRWLWEMNGTWYRWGEEAAKDPALFKRVWQRLRGIADKKGATNITWVWCPNVTGAGTTSLSSLWPGSQYVDWTCMDGYNFGGGGWASFSSVISQTYTELSALAPGKPIMVGETGSAENGGSKSSWTTAALSSLPISFPSIKAFVWFNWNIVEEGVEREWPIESSSAAQEAFASGINSPYFAEGEFGTLPVLTRIKPPE